ncbi:MAG TPA: addiction module protein [Bacteroidia bacterium]|nr:addiction module protein [Bacteroidia bacterium]
MSTLELSQFTLREKLQIMQSIWEDLRSHVERFEVPQSHRDILDERRRRVESGEAKLLDWDQVKHTIGQR